MKRLGAVIFHSPSGCAQVERMVDAGRTAAAFDLAEALHSKVATLILVVPAGGQAAFSALDAEIFPVGAQEEFHFGDVFKRVIREYGLDSVCYFGSGSGPLLSAKQVDQIVAFAQQNETAALFNNFYSCDFASFTDAGGMLRLPLPDKDNGLGFLLADAGVKCYSLPRTLESQFDLDTPVDLLLAKESGRAGPQLRRCLESFPLDTRRLKRLCDVLVERSALTYLVGRVSPATWRTFEKQVACRTAGIIEGRGMKAYADRHPPVLASLCRQGYDDFFRALERSADGAIIDSRPLLAREGTLPPPHERFSSDLFLLESLEDPAWIEFTKSAADCSIPILLGGHSLVSGGLYLLAEICWKGRNLPRRLHPDSYEGDANQHDP